LKTTRYFDAMRQRPDRCDILDEWVEQVIRSPVKEVVQSDGRLRRWGPISASGGKVLRVVLLQDGETVHNAFFDRGFSP
jgi:hypothetical protein